jgi:hypothetical protein
LEKLKKRGLEVLFMVDPIDEYAGGWAHWNGILFTAFWKLMYYQLACFWISYRPSNFHSGEIIWQPTDRRLFISECSSTAERVWWKETCFCHQRGKSDGYCIHELVGDFAIYSWFRGFIALGFDCNLSPGNHSGPMGM